MELGWGAKGKVTRRWRRFLATRGQRRMELYPGFDSPRGVRGRELYFIMHWLYQIHRVCGFVSYNFVIFLTWWPEFAFTKVNRRRRAVTPRQETHQHRIATASVAVGPWPALKDILPSTPVSYLLLQVPDCSLCHSHMSCAHMSCDVGAATCFPPIHLVKSYQWRAAMSKIAKCGRRDAYVCMTL